MKATPLDMLLPYQRRWVDDEARLKIGLMARQTGKDFASGAEGIRDCVESELRGAKTTWLIVAPSERQSLESLEKWKEWAHAYKLAIAEVEEERESRNSQSLIKSTTITFARGSRVIAVPGRPDTVRGFSAHVLATEFAFFEDPDRTWRALLPSITNPLRGGVKKCRLISTPNGKGNKFYDLWAKNFAGSGESGGAQESARAAGATRGSRWSCHKVTITAAAAEGLPVDVEELRAGLDDPEGWAQEYDPLEFMDQSSVLLPYELLAACENPAATEVMDESFYEAGTAEPIFAGMDFGRSRDLTVWWALQLLGGAYKMTREVLCLSDLSTPRQLEILRPRLQAARRVCFDYSGPGVGLGDFLAGEFGLYDPKRHQYGKIELCRFTQEFKKEILSKLRLEFELKTLGIPVSRAVREDLHSMSRVMLPGGGVTYRAAQVEGSHADRCTAAALAVRAASQGQASQYYCCLINP